MARAVRAPEITFQDRWGAPVDIWGLGCVALELLLPHRPFFPDEPPEESYINDFVHLAQMIELLGPFPPETLANSHGASAFFDKDGSVSKKAGRIRLSGRGALREQLARVGLSGAELDETHAFLRRMLALDPAKRATAVELLNDPFMADFDLRATGPAH
ncbi:kinase-like domain-containing protein [Epithele typhae]|uniref:kinase-like domain-containing protein n=1 Tax=Epithele typhae TaxID=378194 RepID=UPI002007E095|nr:kinase-like domain-containing protein [Epithele typhae]KAH9939719.1 kinase-like domain-containing protein [Epithele typhae]